MKRRFRLTRSTDLMRVRRSGKSYAHPLVVLVVHPSTEPATRVACVVGGIIGGAVVRNRIKRRMRACLDEFLPVLLAGWDLVLIARKPIGQADFSQIHLAIRDLLSQSGMLSKDKQDSCDRR